MVYSRNTPNQPIFHVAITYAMPKHTHTHNDVIKWKHFRRTGHLCRVYRWFPFTNASDAELWCFIDLRLHKWLSKQSWRRWFQTPSRSLWRHCYENRPILIMVTQCKLRIYLSYHFPLFILQLIVFYLDAITYPWYNWDSMMVQVLPVSEKGVPDHLKQRFDLNTIVDSLSSL